MLRKEVVMKAVLLDAYIMDTARSDDFEIEKRICGQEGIEFVPARCRTREEIIEAGKDADIIMVCGAGIDAGLMDEFKQCKALVRYGIGYDVFDVDAASERKIMVCNQPDYCIVDVAFHAVSLILGSIRQLLHYSLRVREGIWDQDQGMGMKRPDKLTVGLAGFGHIPRVVASYLKPMGFTVLAYDPYVEEEIFEQAGVIKADKDALVGNSDILSLHLPLTSDTKGFVNEESIKRMKEKVIIVNTARGPIVEQEALIKALESGKVAAAGLDVFEEEPLTDVENPLMLMDNVILTPHVSYRSEDAVPSLCESVANTIVKIAKGEIPRNTVNKKVFAK